MQVFETMDREEREILNYLRDNECSLDEIISRKIGGLYSATTLLRLTHEGYVRRFKRRKFSDKFFYRITDKGLARLGDSE